MFLLFLMFGALILLWASGSFGLWVSGPLLLLASFHVLNTQRFLHLPSPGLCLPVIGHLHKLLTREGRVDPVNTLWNIYKEHSKAGILWVRAFNIDTVYVGDFDIVKKIFNDPDVQDRMFTNFEDYLKEHRGFWSPGIPGVIFNEGQSWLQHRTFTLKTLRDFGFGKSSMNEVIEEEVKHFIENLRETGEKPQDLGPKFSLPIFNSLWKITAGERFNYDDPKLNSILARQNVLFQHMNSAKNMVELAHPWLGKIPVIRQFLDRDTTVNVCLEIIQLIRNKVKEHEDTLDPNDPRDFIDSYLIEISKTTDISSDFYGPKAREQLINIVFDLFIAGSETLSTTLSWAMLCMVRNPGVMEEVQEELDRVVGPDRMPRGEDMDRLPYTQATLREIQRYSNIMPTGLGHVCRRELTVGGFKVPAHTVIHCLYSEVMKGDYWKDGTVFRPSRFLTSSKELRREERLIPFSLGRRQCLGESLARSQLFLYFSTLLHQFSIYPEVPGLPPPEHYRPGITISPQPFTLSLKPRL